MMRREATIFGALALAIVVIASLDAPCAADAREAATVDRLAWLAGCWRQERGERLTEECWLAPRGGLMLGVNRVSGGERAFFEFLRIADAGDGLALFAEPSGQEPASFALIEMGERHVTFENPEHDFPQRISYRLGDDGRLHAGIEGVEAGERRNADWVYTPAGWADAGQAAE